MRLHIKRARFASRLVIDQFLAAVTRTIMTKCKLLVTLSCMLSGEGQDSFKSSMCHSLQQGKHKLFLGLSSCCHASTAGTCVSYKVCEILSTKGGEHALYC